MAPHPLADPLVLAFEAATLEPSRFHHREHLYVAWCYLRELGLDDATARYLRYLRALTLALGVPEKLDAELTREYLRRLEAAMRASVPDATFDQLLAQHPGLCQHLPGQSQTGSSSSP